MSNTKTNNITDYKTPDIVKKHLSRYNNSPEQKRTRKSALNHFLTWYKEENNKQLELHELMKRDIVDYFDYLNNRKDIALATKKVKWSLFKSFLTFCMDYYDDFLVKIPSNICKWNKYHKTPKTNKDVRLDKEEISNILKHLKLGNFKHYLIFRILAETGMRKGEVANIDYDKVNTSKRYIDTHGKMGRKIYYISEELTNYLKIFIESRKTMNINTKALFISRLSKRYSKRAFNFYLKKVLDTLEIKKNATCKTFRSSLNTYRKLMGCSNEDRHILINHKLKDININNYLKLNYKEYIALYDKWYPYKEYQF